MIVAEKVEGDIGTTLETSDVLLVGTRDSTVVGRPTVPGATVKLYVEEQTRDKKVRPRASVLFCRGGGRRFSSPTDSLGFQRCNARTRIRVSFFFWKKRFWCLPVPIVPRIITSEAEPARIAVALIPFFYVLCGSLLV